MTYFYIFLIPEDILVSICEADSDTDEGNKESGERGSKVGWPHGGVGGGGGGGVIGKNFANKRTLERSNKVEETASILCQHLMFYGGFSRLTFMGRFNAS